MKRRKKLTFRTSSLDARKSLAQPLFLEYPLPEDVLRNLIPFIYKKGPSLPFSEYDEVAENIWVHKSAYLSSSVKIDAPAIIGAGAKLCHGAHVRASIIGDFSSIGDNCEVIGSIVFDRARLNFGDIVCGSIIGHGARIASGVSVCEDVCLSPSASAKIGAVICDFASVGTNSVISSGVLVDEYATIPPLSTVCCDVKPFSVYKGK